MKKQLRYFLTLLLVMVASVGWAEEEVFYTLSYERGSNNSYAGNCDIEIGGITWNVTGNAQQNPWRIGGKSITNTDRAVYSKTAMTDATTKVILEVGAASSITVNSLKLIVASDANFSNQIDEVTATFAANNSNITFTPTSGTEWTAGAYYKFVFNVTVSGNSNRFVEFKSASFYKESGSATAATTSVTINSSGITNTDIYTDTAAGQLTATVSDDTDTAIEGATVTWTSSKENVATIAADGTVTLVAEGTTTLTASYAGVENVYRSSSATYELTVTNNDPNKPGSLNNPYTVAQALANTPASGKSADVYVRGIVSGFYSSTITGDGSNYRYYISDDGTTTNQMMVYKGKGLNNVAFANDDDLLIGDEVVIKGGLTTYQSTKEIAANNYIVSLNRNTSKVATPTFTPAAGTYSEVQNVEITTATDGATIYYTTDGTDPDATSTTSTEYTAAIPVAQTMTIKAIAVKEGMTDSEIATAEYIIKIITVNPKNIGSNYFVKVTDAADLEDGDAILIVHEDSKKAMSTTQNTNNRASAVIEIVDNAIEPAEDVQKLVLVDAGDNQWMFCAGTSADAGFLTAASSGNNYLRTTADPDDNANATIEVTDGNAAIVFQGNYTKNDLRFNANSGQMLFSCYASSSTMKSVQIYKEVEKPTSVTVTIGETEYATLYYSKVGLIVPEGVTANAYSVSGTTLNVVQTYNAGDVIPAATGVVLNGAQGDYTFNITEENGTAAEGNMLSGSDVDKPTTGGAKYYMLSLNADSDPSSIGFYYGATDGAAFTNKAHRAYLVVPEGTEAKATGYAFNEVTGINDITREQVTDGVWYTIDGKRLNGEPTVKGIYVVNGKKVVIK